MTDTYRGRTIPALSDAADAPTAFLDYVASGPVIRVADAAARNAAIPSPVDGIMVYRQDTNLLERYDSAQGGWIAFGYDLTTINDRYTTPTMYTSATMLADISFTLTTAWQTIGTHTFSPPSPWLWYNILGRAYARGRGNVYVTDVDIELRIVLDGQPGNTLAFPANFAYAPSGIGQPANSGDGVVNHYRTTLSGDVDVELQGRRTSGTNPNVSIQHADIMAWGFRTNEFSIPMPSH